MDAIRVLIVDDEADLCEVLVQFIKRLGYTAKFATDGPAGMVLVQNFQPHFIFLDVMMPDMNGIEVLREIRKIDKAVKVIMISGMHDLGIAKQAMQLGALDYMPKPIVLEDLGNFLHREIKKLQSGGEDGKVHSIMHE